MFHEERFPFGEYLLTNELFSVLFLMFHIKDEDLTTASLLEPVIEDTT